MRFVGNPLFLEASVSNSSSTGFFVLYDFALRDFKLTLNMHSVKRSMPVKMSPV